VGARYYNNAWQVFSHQAYGDVIQAGNDSGAANAFAVTPAPAFAAWADLTDRILVFKAAQTNTGASTLQVSGLATPKNVKKNGGAALDPADVLAGQWVAVRFDGTDFHLLSATASNNNLYGVDAGSTDAYAVTIANFALTSYYAGLRVWFKANTKNTGAATLSVNGIAAGTIKKLNGVDLQDGDILAGMFVHVVHDGTNWQLIGASSIMATSAVAIPATNTATLVAHGLPAAPRYMRWVLVCQSNEAGFQAGPPGDEVDITSFFNGSTAGQNFTTFADATNVGCQFISTNLSTFNKGTGVASTINPPNWKLKCYYAP
jgi:hypothetical protein